MALLSWSAVFGVNVLICTLFHRSFPQIAPFSAYALPYLLLCLVEFLGLQVYKIIIYPHFFSPLRHLPTPPGASFLNGHFSQILKDPSGHPQLRWIKTVPNQGLIRYMTVFNKERVMVTDAKGLAEVMTLKSYEYVKPPQFAQSLGRILGLGILFAEGDEHKTQRKNLAPAFAFRHVKDLYPIFWAKAREMILAIESARTTPDPTTEKPPTALEIGGFANRATLDIIGVAGLDNDFHALADPTNKLYLTYKTIFNAGRAAQILGILSIFMPIGILRRLPIKRNQEILAASRLIKETCMNVILSKKAQLEKGGTSAANLGTDILSVALKSGGFTDDELVNQLMTFLAAGHETTAGSTNWAIYLLCRNLDVQKRLREELRKADLPSPFDANSTVKPELVDRIAYLTAVCNEVLRFIPPVPFTMRIAANDTTLLGEQIPKGTVVILCPEAVNHAPSLWGPTGEIFDPERWIDEDGKANNMGGASSNYANLTFLHGPRSCIGQGFAKSEFACLVAALFSAFEFKLEDEAYMLDIVGGVVQRPKVPIRVKLVRLEG